MFARAESLVLIIIIGMVALGYKRIPDAIRNVRKARRVLKSETQAMRDDVPLPANRVIVAEPGDVAPGAAQQSRNQQAP